MSEIRTTTAVLEDGMGPRISLSAVSEVIRAKIAWLASQHGCEKQVRGLFSLLSLWGFALLRRLRSSDDKVDGNQHPANKSLHRWFQWVICLTGQRQRFRTQGKILRRRVPEGPWLDSLGWCLNTPGGYHNLSAAPWKTVKQRRVRSVSTSLFAGKQKEGSCRVSASWMLPVNE